MSDETLLHISLIPNIGPAVIKRLKDFSDAEIYGADEMAFINVGVPRHQATLLVSGLRDKNLLEQELVCAKKYGITVVTMASPTYPDYLRAIHMPPPVLYVQGSVDVMAQSSIAMIGSRAANAYGRAAVELLVPSIIAEQWVVVSGGARGIDACVHQETLKGGGMTVAVLGSGLLRPYPREHVALFTRIAESGGAVISPFPLTMSPIAGNFPARNRVISGLTRASIVVQAAAKSGALITALQALAEGREVGVVPGHITDPLSVGCHKLLRDGATPITSIDDVRALMGCNTVQRDVVISNAPKQQSVLEEACRTPRSFDELLSLVNGDEQQLHQQLWDLQIDGRIEQTNAGLWHCR